ncbi:MAG: hypothetical protein F8N37_22190 [Telmatospirillum sp.]|nr:hypothetical protein [Telmatospirillum sp.]
MVLRSALVAALVVLCSVSAGAKEKEGGATPQGGSTEIQAKLAPSYVAVPRLHLPVQVDANRNFRALDLEVWLLQADPEKHQILNSKKKQIAEKMRETFSAYGWEAFQDSQGGPDIAKRIVAQCVTDATGTTVEDVLIKTLILK